MANPRIHAFAEQFEQSNNEFIAVVERCSPEQWQTTCLNERAVGVIAHHVAESHLVISNWVQAVAHGTSPEPVTKAMFVELNAQHATEHANCTQAETLELLRHNGDVAAGVVRSLNDSQLDQSMPFALFDGPASTEQLIGVLIGHPRSHLKTIRMATGL